MRARQLILKTTQTMRMRVAPLLLSAMMISPAWALSESHLIIIRHGEGQCDVDNRYDSNPKSKAAPCELTDKGRTQVKEVSELLLSHGFDNRNIAAVYVSSLPRAKATALHLAEVGLFNADKIHVDKRLDEIKAGDREGALQTDAIRETWLVGEHEAKAYHGESNEAVRKRMLKWFSDVTDKPPHGHIVVITHGIPAMELIESHTHQRLKLATGQVYVMPVNATT